MFKRAVLCLLCLCLALGPAACAAGGAGNASSASTVADAGVAALNDVLPKLYTAPASDYDELVEYLASASGEVAGQQGGTGLAEVVPPEDAASRLAEYYAGRIAPEYLDAFFINFGGLYHNYTGQTGGSMLFQSVTVEPAENDGEYSYSAELLCTVPDGTESTLTTTGTACLNADGQIENFNPHAGREILQAIGMV